MGLRGEVKEDAIPESLFTQVAVGRLVVEILGGLSSKAGFRL